jgi:NADPH2:quinone reductase
MRAIIYRDYGNPSVLQLVEAPAPEAARDEVLIKVMAAGINPIDARLRRGELKWLLPGGFPRIPGYDVAGVVHSAGPNVPFAIGDRVMAFLDHIYGGGYAEYAACSANSVAPIPPSMSFEEAAALPLAGSTALQSLRDIAHLRAGQSVLINGASGGVGAYAVQVAKALGGRVTGVARKEHEDFVLSLGAEDFLDYRAQKFWESNRNWDVIFDVSGKCTFTEARKVLSPTGHFVSTEPNLRGLIMSLATWPMSQHGSVMLACSRDRDLRELLRLHSEGQLRTSIAECFPLAGAAAAHRRLEAGGFCGKLVLRTAE